MKKSVVGLDFETETDEDGNARPLICCLNAEKWEQTYELQDRGDYVRFYLELITSGDTYVVFNASFDVEIIMTILLKNGFKFLANEGQPQHKTMKMLMGQKIYQLKTYYNYKGKLVESNFIDLANLIPGSTLEEVASKFTHLEKGNYEASKENWEEFKKYCMLDAEITRLAYERLSGLLGSNYITIGGASFDIMLKMNFKGNNKKALFGQFRGVYGKLTIEEDRKMRKWYGGGFGWASTDDRTEVNIHSYDRISAYPAESVKSLPTFRDKRTYNGYKAPTEEFPFAFIHMKVTGQVKKNHAPVLPSRNIYGDSNVYIYNDKDVYIIQIFGEKSEYEWFMENMEIELLEYEETILMKEAYMNPMKSYMERFYELKRTSSGVEREFAKLLLNSLTGKLGTNPEKANMVFKLDETNTLVRDVDKTETTIIDTYAVHTISVITSRARCALYEVDAQIRDKVSFRLYATDSVKYSSSEKLIKEGTEWGEWALEHESTDFIYLGLKAYIFDPYNKQGKRNVMCAGISKKYKNQITNEQFYASNKAKTLISVRRGNGRVIYEGYKQIATPVRKPRRR